jgi:hypothetical protein
MSKLAVKLFEERENEERNVPRMDNYLPLLRALFGEENYDPSLNKNICFDSSMPSIKVKS